MQSIKSNILETVKKNAVTMIPRWKFVLYSCVGAISIIFVLLVLIFIVSLILFVLSRYGFLDMPFFGFMETLRMLVAVPFSLFLCTIILLVLIEILSRTYSFTFRRPLSVTLLGITLVVTGISYMISQTSMHEYVREYMRNHHLEIMTRAYDRPRPPKLPDAIEVVRGEVVATSSSGMIVRLFDGSVITAIGTTSNGVQTLRQLPDVGDDIVMMGVFTGKQFEVLRSKPALRSPFGDHRPRHAGPPHTDSIHVK